ncbi:MAG TPA: GNAT family N-acetyltransferase [Brevundimonas sp.]|nr:GNAT family N-acetyltransferase [Brevundimonas sp.]
MSESVAERLADLHAGAFDAPWDAAAFATLLDQPGVAAAVTPDGFILIRTVAGEAEILTLAVRPAARRRGVGADLLAQALILAAAGGAGRIFLEVAEDNTAARALYAGAGFAEAGRRRGYYGRKDGPAADALVLARDLGNALP